MWCRREYQTIIRQASPTPYLRASNALHFLLSSTGNNLSPTLVSDASEELAHEC